MIENLRVVIKDVIAALAVFPSVLNGTLHLGQCDGQGPECVESSRISLVPSACSDPMAAGLRESLGLNVFEHEFVGPEKEQSENACDDGHSQSFSLRHGACAEEEVPGFAGSDSSAADIKATTAHPSPAWISADSGVLVEFRLFRVPRQVRCGPIKRALAKLDKEGFGLAVRFLHLDDPRA